jgi:Cu+-exporting ATPase
MVKDPVCGMDVDEKAPLKSAREGQNYVFCSASCKEKFDGEPARYAPADMEVTQPASRT